MEQNNNVGLYEYKQNNIQYFDHLQKKTKKKKTCSIKKKIKKVLGKKKHKRVQRINWVAVHIQAKHMSSNTNIDVDALVLT